MENDSSITIGFAIGLAAIIIFDSYVAAVIIFIGSFISIYEQDGKLMHILNSSIYKRAFNASNHAITALISANIYLLSTKYLSAEVAGLNILGIFLTTLTYTIVTTVIFMIFLSLITKRKFSKLFLQNIWVLKNFIAIAPLGVLMAVFYINYGLFALLFFFGPLILARYSFKLYLNMKKAYFDTINSLTHALEAKDEYTNGHSRRVAEYSIKIARELRFNELRLDSIRTAALLHDIGKIGISDTIINKPAKLTETEFSKICEHPEIGSNIIEGVGFLADVSKIIKHHHEKYDGSGYPDGLIGDNIPYESAVLMVADAFDAMTTDRPYRNALTESEAINELNTYSGVQFNPKIVLAVNSILKKEGSIQIVD